MGYDKLAASLFRLLQLRLLGLRMQGFEVRGWRTSPTRRWLRSLRFPRIQIPRIPGLHMPMVACRK